MCLRTNWFLMSRRYNVKKKLCKIRALGKICFRYAKFIIMRVLSMPKSYCSATFIKMNNSKSPKLSNASSSKQMGNQATSFPPFYKPQKIKTSMPMCRSKLLKFHLNQAGFGQGSSQSEILGENYVPIKKGSKFFDTKLIFNGIN